ncbi:MAG: class I SAM-dependent methyltransferase, partial [Candidatus Omnitrophica bacterium]|nr:class I SAM-dependent methyltransferase [Candidatus Omnitrophota bacterium]
DWNQYWELDQTQRFTRISWSKRRILRILNPYLRPGSRALDAGCGSGFFSQFFCEAGLHATALDYAQSALDIAGARTKGKAKLVRANLLEDSLEAMLAARYQVIFTDGLLEHFVPADQDRIILNLRSVLADDGVIFTFVPNRWSPWELIRPLYMPGIKEDPFRLPELVDLHERNQLQVMARGGINTVPFGFSPDGLLGATFGMLLYTITKKR